MKIPKPFLYIIILTQAILTFGHWLLYASLLLFFPAFQSFHLGLLIGLLILSASFLATSVQGYKNENAVLRWLYIGSGLWLVLWFYLLIACAIVSLAYIFAPGFNIQNFATVIFSAALALALYGTINSRVVRITKIRLKLANMPEFWKGKTAVLATDIHLGHVLRSGSAKKIVNIINRLSPDIVFIAGDFFDGIHTNFAHLAESFKQLKTAQGAYFCSGNHELYAGMAECEQAIRDVGIVVLENQKVEIQGLQIAGLAYELNQTDETIRARLKLLNLDPGLPSILLKHVPAQIPVVEQAGVSLLLSGHSHRGQIWPIYYVTSIVFKGFDYGLKQYHNLAVYTSSGVGTWGPPVRIFTQSEIAQITFI